MEKMTMKLENHYICNKSKEVCEKQEKNEKDELCCCECKINQEMMDKLGRYEEMEEEGKLLKLPCKPGDTVYIAKKEYGINKVITAKVTGICRSRNEEGEKNWCIKVFEKNGEYLIPFEKFGKIAFINKQEAKKALERIKNEKRYF